MSLSYKDCLYTFNHKIFYFICCTIGIDVVIADIPADQFFAAAEHGLQKARDAREFFQKHGHLGGLQPGGIVEAFMYALRNAKLVLQLHDAKDVELSQVMQLEWDLPRHPNHNPDLEAVDTLIQRILNRIPKSSLHEVSFRPNLALAVPGRSAPTHWQLNIGLKEAMTELGDGTKMPLVGFGTGIFYSTPEAAAEAIRFAAAELGYRHFDCAAGYHNEELVGEALRASGVARQELFISTKLSDPDGVGYQETQTRILRQMDNLRVEYLDMYMFHADPSGLVGYDREKEAWQALEALHSMGKIRSLGLSNYDANGIQRIVSFAKVKPVYLQIKYDVYNPGYHYAPSNVHDLTSWAQAAGLTVVGYSTLSGWPFPLRAVQDPHVHAIATKYNKSSGQLLLRHSLQNGLAVIPTSVDAKRLQENTEIFDFEISSSDMLCLDGLAHLVSLALDDSPSWVPDIYGARALGHTSHRTDL